MRKITHDCKGSTLVILLLTISVIILIGTMALSLAITNYKMKNLNSEVKKTFYLAEAGLEEAYAIANDFVGEAVTYAISKVEEFEALEMYNKESIQSTQYSINDDTKEEQIIVVFISAFKNFIKGTCKDISPNDSLVSVLKKNSFYVTYVDGYPKIDSKITEFKDYFIVEVKSTYIKGSIKKEIFMKYRIDIPKYDSNFLPDDFKVRDIIQIIEWKIER